MVKLTRCKVGCLDEVTRVGRDCLAQHRPDSFSSFTRNPPTHTYTSTILNRKQFLPKKNRTLTFQDTSLFYPLSYLMFRPPSENPALQGQYLLSGVGVPYPAIVQLPILPKLPSSPCLRWGWPPWFLGLYQKLVSNSKFQCPFQRWERRCFFLAKISQTLEKVSETVLGRRRSDTVSNKSFRTDSVWDVSHSSSVLLNQINIHSAIQGQCTAGSILNKEVPKVELGRLWKWELN